MQEEDFFFLKLELKGFEWKKKESRLSRVVRKVFIREDLGYVWFSVHGARLLIWGKFSLDLGFCEHKLLEYSWSEDLAARG